MLTHDAILKEIWHLVDRWKDIKWEYGVCNEGYYIKGTREKNKNVQTFRWVLSKEILENAKYPQEVIMNAVLEVGTILRNDRI